MHPRPPRPRVLAGLLGITAAIAAASVQARAQAAPPAQAPAAVGDWLGTLEVPGAQLRLVFHITNGEDGLEATLDSPDQGAFGIAIQTVETAGDSVRLLLPALSGRYDGVLSGDTLRGTWAQGGMSFPLELVRTTEEIDTSRPQDPELPLPYDTLEVRVPNAEAGIELVGTLTTPRGDGPFPAAVLVSGSGPQNRDEALMGHRPFRVLSDYLTRHGIAVLRFDDRGVAESGGEFATATTPDFASDARAAAHWLRDRPEVDASAIGIIGHSEGGLIAPIVANTSDDVHWIVLLAGPGIPGDSLIRLQMALILEAAGTDSATIAQRVVEQDELQRAVRESGDDREAARRIGEVLRASVAGLTPAERTQGGLGSPAQVDSLVARSTRQLLSPWMRYFLSYDPRPALRGLRVPTLALIGGRDLQVPADENAPAIRRALAESESPAWAVRVLPGLNHLFQHATTGSPDEYSGIEETFAPEAMAMIADWIREVTGR
jgi:dienelactone hydrolase